LTPACADLFKPSGSGLDVLKSTFNAENFICRFSWSISSHFVAIYCGNVRCSQKLRKNLPNPLFRGSRSFKVIQPPPPSFVATHDFFAKITLISSFFAFPNCRSGQICGFHSTSKDQKCFSFRGLHPLHP